MSTRYLEGEEGWKKVLTALGTQGFCLGEGVLRLPLGLSLGLYSCAYQVTFSEESLPKGHGDFILGYYSHHHSILIGVTEPFQVNRSDSRAPSASKRIKKSQSNVPSSGFCSGTPRPAALSLWVCQLGGRKWAG